MTTMNEKFSKSGIFTVASGRQMHGTLTLDGGNSVLDLSEIGSEEFHPPDLGNRQIIDGTLDDQKWVSLVDCTYQGRSSFGGFEGFSHHHEFYPHFAVVGGPRFKGDISQASFIFDDAEVLFHDRESFGDLIDSKKIRELLRDEGVSIENEAHPFLYYWTGKTEILSTETAVGKISVRHSPTMKMGGYPIAMTNRVVVWIDFPDSVDLWKLNDIVDRILRFFAIIAGRPQNLLDLEIHQEVDGRLQSSSVYLNTFGCRPKENERRKPYFYDTLMDAVAEPRNFTRLMSAWLEHDKTRNLARARFMNGWEKQRSYDADRIVGAANMFDLLPGDTAPGSSRLSDDLLSAIAESQRLLRALPPSDKRDGILGFLGGIATPSLKAKIKHRAATFLTVAIGGDLPELDSVIDAAVEVRNLYVHGDRPDKRRAKLVRSTVFLTNTLEFIFVVSELVESGWELGRWRQQRLSSHPFANYLRGYAEDLAELKNC